MNDVNNEVLSVEDDRKKEWMGSLIDNIKERMETQTPVRFEILNIKRNSFFVKSEGLYACVPFIHMPWRYRSLQLWEIITPSLIGKSFTGYVYGTQDETPYYIRVVIKADKSQFDNVVFPFEENKTYTAIVLQKGKNRTKIDLGYAFEWKYGSYEFNMYDFQTEDKIEPGNELKFVYVGKTELGNDLFRYGENHYCSKEINHKHYTEKEEETIEEIKIVEKETPKEEERQKIKGNFSGLKTLKIVGKIDLDAINSKTKPKKKSQTQKLKENEERFRIEKEKRNTFKEARRAKRKEIREAEEQKRQEEAKQRMPVGTVLWLSAKRSSRKGLHFSMPDKFIGKIILTRANYPEYKSLTPIEKAMDSICVRQSVLCRIQSFLPNRQVALRWEIEEDQIAQTFLNQLVTPEKKRNLIGILRGWLKNH